MVYGVGHIRDMVEWSIALLLLLQPPVADLERIKGGCLDWNGVNWPVNNSRWTLSPKCHYEYQEMGGGGGGG